MTFLLHLLLHLAIPGVILTHLLASPYTKVEESFTLHAAHDILRHGMPTSNVTAFLAEHYDHMTFSGAVPRSFVGPLVLAGCSKPFIALFGGVVNEQVIVRGVQGLLTALALTFFAIRARRAYGSTTARLYLLLQLTQFHIPYYASRTLPNVFALQLSLVAQAFFLPSPSSSSSSQRVSHKLGIYALVLGGIIFRAELALLLLFHASYLVLTRRASLLHDILPAGIIGGIVGLALTLSVDSYFWQSYVRGATPFSTPLLTERLGLIWPELSAFHFNAVAGHASDWGTSAWHHYFSNALPRLLLNPYAFLVLPLGAVVAPSVAAQLALPNLAFVAAYSALPHKEWRFVVYAVPALTLLAARAADFVWTRRGKRTAYWLGAVALAASLPATALMSATMLAVSATNYPGGQALSALHSYLPDPRFFSSSSSSPPPSSSSSSSSSSSRDSTPKIHLDVPVCMTGATRFLMEAPLWPDAAKPPQPLARYDKTEEPAALLRTPEFWHNLHWVITQAPETTIGSYERVASVGAFSRVRVYAPGEEVAVPVLGVVDETGASRKWAGDVEGRGGVEKEEEQEKEKEKQVEKESRWVALGKRALGDGFGLRNALLRGWWVGVETAEMAVILRRQPPESAPL